MITGMVDSYNGIPGDSVWNDLAVIAAMGRGGRVHGGPAVAVVAPALSRGHRSAGA